MFYKLEKDKTFVYIARSVLPVTIKQNSADFFGFGQIKGFDKIEYFWTIDLVKYPDHKFSSTFAIGLLSDPEQIKTVEDSFETREEALAFISLPNKFFHNNRTSCLIINEKIDSKKIEKIVEKWCSDELKRFNK
jgi:hypothetical protein